MGDVEQAIGKSVAGNTTKIHMAVESNGMPIEFEITGGQVQDYKVAPELIVKLPYSKYKIADKGYSSEKLRRQIREQGSYLLFLEKIIQPLEIMIWIGVYINTDIYRKSFCATQTFSSHCYSI